MGFRPFFLLAGFWALAALVIFLISIQGLVALPLYFDLITWHWHEMLFGFVAATLTGFLLTAIPNWTGHLPLQGFPLFGLVLIWAAGRIGVVTADWIGALPAAVLDLSFLAVVLAIGLREIIAGRNWRNLPIVCAVALFLFGNFLSHADGFDLVVNEGLAQRLSVAVMVMLITLIGGRIVPSFTRNWLKKKGHANLPAPFGPVDAIALALTLVALGWWTVQPEGPLTAGLAAGAAIANLIRICRWRGWMTGAEPLVWVLHLGYLWIPFGLALVAVSHWWPSLPQNSALHAFTAGAMGTMTLAVMSRATMGHTGRALQAGPALTAAYGLVTVAAASRIAVPLLDGGTEVLLWIAGLAWIGSFTLFLISCGPMLVTRPSGASNG
jgi:uncharacterized protein involved in response to NO